MSELSPEAASLQHALTGQYELLREVGRGGMGIVYLGHDLKLDRPVAIKTLPGTMAGDPVIRQRFLREARTAAALSHPNIVPIYRADEIDGHVFFAMGFVSGAPLSRVLAEGGPLTPRTAISLLHDVAGALGYAHRAGVVHRDVKAENILIEQSSGRAMVTDFGIARLAEATPLTATGTVLGTVYYMSPEQVAGDVVDPRSDIYSLGVVAFLALSGRFPFESSTASAVLVAHVTRAAPSLESMAPTVPRELADIVDRCLAKNPASRFQSCEEFRVALEDAESDLPFEDVAAPRPGLPQSISSADAQAIWERAARLQDATGPMPALQAPASGAARPRPGDGITSGYQLDQVRDAAREAGIGTAFVDRALVERGLAAANVAGLDSGVIVREGIRPARNPWLGGHSTIAWEAIVSGEMAERDFDLILDTIKRMLNDAGAVGQVGRSLSWTSVDRQRKVQVTVLVRDGKTTIHASERLRELIGGLFGGIMGGGTGASMGPIIGLTIATLHAPMLVPVAILVSLGTTYTIARTILRRVSRSRSNTLKSLVERLADQARDSVARRTVGSGGRERKLIR